MTKVKMMYEQRFVAENVEILDVDENKSREAIVVFDTENIISYEVKDEYVAMELANVLNEQQNIIRKQDITITELNLHIERLVDESETCQLLMKEYERNEQLEAKNEVLRKALSKIPPKIREVWLYD